MSPTSISTHMKNPAKKKPTMAFSNGTRGVSSSSYSSSESSLTSPGRRIVGIFAPLYKDDCASGLNSAEGPGSSLSRCQRPIPDVEGLNPRVNEAPLWLSLADGARAARELSRMLVFFTFRA